MFILFSSTVNASVKVTYYIYLSVFVLFLDGLVMKEDCDESSVQLMDQSALLREIISRTYGAPIIRDGHIVCDMAFKPHPNLLKASVVVETNNHFFIIHVSISNVS